MCDIMANLKKRRFQLLNANLPTLYFRNQKKTPYLFCRVLRNRLALRWSKVKAFGFPFKELQHLEADSSTQANQHIVTYIKDCISCRVIECFNELLKQKFIVGF